MSETRPREGASTLLKVKETYGLRRGARARGEIERVLRQRHVADSDKEDQETGRILSVCRVLKTEEVKRPEVMLQRACGCESVRPAVDAHGSRPQPLVERRQVTAQRREPLRSEQEHGPCMK